MHSNVLVRLAAGIRRRPKIVSTICTVEREKGWHMTLERWTARLADRIVCISQAVRTFCLTRGLPADRLVVIHPGIDLDRIRTAIPGDPVALGLTPSTTRLCYLGRLDPVKNIDVILRALTLLARPDLELLIIGDGPQRPELETLARDLMLTNQVRFLGFREDYPSLLKLCRIFCLASRQEGWGIAVSEALTADLMVVATNVDALPEQVRSNNEGVLVDPDDPKAFAQGILSVLTPPNPPNPRTVQTTQTEAQEYLHLYRQLLAF